MSKKITNGVKVKKVGSNAPITYVSDLNKNGQVIPVVLGSHRPLLMGMTTEQKQNLKRDAGTVDHSSIDFYTSDQLDRQEQIRVTRKNFRTLSDAPLRQERERICSQRIYKAKPYFNEKVYKILLKCEQIKDCKQAHKLASDEKFCKAFLAKLNSK